MSNSENSSNADLSALQINVVPWSSHQEKLRHIRGTVFIEEQGVSQDIEWDDQDVGATHFMVTLGGSEVGCGRRLDDGKVGRMAILAEYRGRGFGLKLLQAIVTQAKSQGLARLYLHAQQHASDFYQAAGFKVLGEPFSEAGIAHIGMEMKLDYEDVNSFITGVSYPQPFDVLATTLCSSATRQLRIQSPQLDHRVFDSADLYTAVSALARGGRHTQIRILVSDSRPIVQRGHRLLALARRLPSSIQIQKLVEHPELKGETVVIRDLNGVLFKPGDSDHQGFYEPDSRASTKKYIETFDYLWERSTTDVELRSLGI